MQSLEITAMETTASQAIPFHQTGDRSDHGHLQKGIDAIFFDLDNTLVQTRAVDERACNEVCSYMYGFSLNVPSCLLFGCRRLLSGLLRCDSSYHLS